MAVNLDGPFFGCRKALNLMVAQGSGVIINNASIAAFYAKKGIRCNAICPGAVVADGGWTAI